MPVRKLPPPPSSADLQSSRDAIREVEEALRAGRAPRTAKQLRAAARGFESAGDLRTAAQAYEVLSRLELQRGNTEQALAPARAALRMARAAEAPVEIARVLLALAHLQSRLGEHPAALRHVNEAVHEAWASGDPALFAEAMRVAAIAAWEAGQPLYALARLEEAGERALDPGRRAELQRVHAVVLAQMGCPSAAARELSALLKGGDCSRSVPLLLARGWVWCALGRPDTGARDFRKARRMARERQDRSREIEATAAVAAADAQRSGTNAPLAARAAAAASRAQRQGSRYRDERLARTLELMGARSGTIPTVSEAADALVRLARQTEDLRLVDACILEVERLNRLPAGAPAYGCPLPLPIVLD